MVTFHSVTAPLIMVENVSVLINTKCIQRCEFITSIDYSDNPWDLDTFSSPSVYDVAPTLKRALVHSEVS